MSSSLNQNGFYQFQEQEDQWQIFKVDFDYNRQISTFYKSFLL